MESRPKFEIDAKLKIENTMVQFDFRGREDQVKILARELFYHYSGDYLFGDMFTECRPADSIIGHRVIEYPIAVSLRNTEGVATILWCLGKVTGDFLTPTNVIENARDHVIRYPEAKLGGLREAVHSLESAALLAISRKANLFEFKYTNFKHLQADDVSKSFWTDAEQVQAQAHLERLQNEKELAAISLKGWSLRLFYREDAPQGKQIAKYCPPCNVL